MNQTMQGMDFDIMSYRRHPLLACLSKITSRNKDTQCMLVTTTCSQAGSTTVYPHGVRAKYHRAASPFRDHDGHKRPQIDLSGPNGPKV